MEGRERIMLGSNCYLGLASDSRVKQAAADALEQYGTGLTGSRLMNGTTRLHEELEAEIADWMWTEASLVTTTGYHANISAIAGLVDRGDTVICDRFDHASIQDGCVLSGATVRRFEHGSLEDLERQLQLATQDDGGVLVVADGVYSMEGKIGEIGEIVELCGRYEVRVMIDEAHAVGVLGATGRGTCELFGVEDDVDIRMGTFSKALASCGGFLAADEDVIDYLRYIRNPFLFTASGVPAALGAALAAVKICRSPEGAERFAKVRENSLYLHGGLKDLGFKVNESFEMSDGEDVVSPVVAVTIGDDIQSAIFWNRLFENGVYTNAAVYPSVPRDGALIRASVMALHEKKHLDRAIEVFESVKLEFPDLPGPA